MKQFILILLVLAGCGAEQACQSSGRVSRRTPRIGDCTPEQVSPRVNPQLQYAVELFSNDATRHEVPCQTTPIVGFSSDMGPDKKKGVVGYCIDNWEVRVLTSYWQTASATDRLLLMYHELGHCALGLDHLDGEIDIMNSYLLDDVTAEKEWDDLVNKMFERKKK